MGDQYSLYRWRARPICGLGAVASAPGARSADARGLEASLSMADLVICQTGCLGHGAYWRVQDHCKRTGKTCVLVEQPDAVRIVRVQRRTSGAGVSIDGG